MTNQIFFYMKNIDGKLPDLVEHLILRSSYLEEIFNFPSSLKYLHASKQFIELNKTNISENVILIPI